MATKTKGTAERSETDSAKRDPKGEWGYESTMLLRAGRGRRATWSVNEPPGPTSMLDVRCWTFDVQKLTTATGLDFPNRVAF